MERVHEPKAPNWDELDSEWVPFHNGKTYLLPVVTRDQKYAPVFNDDGTVTLRVSHKTDYLGEVLESFLDLMGNYDKAQPWQWTNEMCGQFFGVVRTLLKRNYAFTNVELSQLLTVNNAQLEVLFRSLFPHILRK